MKKEFKNRLEAIDWIARTAESEAQFEVWREQLTFNHIYHQSWFLELDDDQPVAEIVWLGRQKR